jgi:hypothetical protein
VRTLSPGEAKQVKGELRKLKGKYKHGKRKSGDKVQYKGKTWLIYDLDRSADAPEGVELVLVSPDGSKMASGVRVDLLDEANISVPSGGSKSDFRGTYPGPRLPPNDEEAMSPMSHSGGVRGPGYGRHGRERVDVRTEDQDLRFSRSVRRSAPDFSMATGAFAGERGIAPMGRDTMNEDEAVDANGNFDPTKLKYPKELIGR